MTRARFYFGGQIMLRCGGAEDGAVAERALRAAYARWALPPGPQPPEPGGKERNMIDKRHRQQSGKRQRSVFAFSGERYFENQRGLRTRRSARGSGLTRRSGGCAAPV